MSIKIAINVEGERVMGESDLFSADSRYEVNGIPRLRLKVRDGDLAKETFETIDADTFKPGKKIQLAAGFSPDVTPVPVFSGVITGLKLGIEGVPYLEIIAHGAAIKLTERPVSLLLNEETDDKTVIESLLTAAGVTGVTIADSTIKHPQFAVYQQTPWRAVMGRMLVNGFVYVPGIESDAIVDLAAASPADVPVSFTTHDVRRLELESDARAHIGEISADTWDIETQALLGAEKGKAGSFKALAGADAVLNRSALSLVAPYPLTQPEIKARAGAEMLFRQLDLFQGRVTLGANPASALTAITLMSNLELSGLGKQFSDKYPVTGIRHRITVSGWVVDFTLGLPLRRTLFSDAAQLPPLTFMTGKVAEFAEHAQLPNTIPVILPPIDGAKPLYARPLSPFAGIKEGFFFPPRQDDEVIVGFVGGSAGHPVILGSCHNPVNEPPFAYDGQYLQRGLLIALEEENMALLVDAENKKLELSLEKDAKNVLALSADDLALTSKDEQAITLADTTAFSGAGNLELATDGDFAVEAGGAASIKASSTEIK